MRNKPNDIAILSILKDNINTVEQCISSVLDNSLKPKHIILVDNESKDGTYEKICGLFGINPVESENGIGFPSKFDSLIEEVKITGVRIRNSGYGQILINSLQFVTEDINILGLINPNSVFDKHKIETEYNVFSKYPFVVGTISDYIQKNGVLNNRIFCHSFDGNLLNRELLYDGNILIRKNILRNISLKFNRMFYYELLIMLSQHGIIYHIPDSMSTMTNQIIIDWNEIRNMRDVYSKK